MDHQQGSQERRAPFGGQEITPRDPFAPDTVDALEFSHVPFAAEANRTHAPQDPFAVFNASRENERLSNSAGRGARNRNAFTEPKDPFAPVTREDAHPTFVQQGERGSTFDGSWDIKGSTWRTIEPRDPFAPDSQRDAPSNPAQSNELLIRHVPVPLFGEQEIRTHFVRTANVSPANVSARSNFRNGHANRTVLVKFENSTQAALARRLGGYFGDLELNMSYYHSRTTHMQGIEQAAQHVVDETPDMRTVANELVLKCVPPGLADKKALKKHMEADAPGAVNFVSIRESHSRSGAPRRTAIISFRTTELAQNALRTASSFEGIPLQLSIRKVFNKQPKSGHDTKAYRNEMQQLIATDDDVVMEITASREQPEGKPASAESLARASKKRELQAEADKLRTQIAELERGQLKKKKAAKLEEMKRRAIEGLQKKQSNRDEKTRADLQFVPKSSSLQSGSNRVNIEDAVDFVGTCPTMCPVAEMSARELQRDLSIFERLSGHEYRVDPKRAVKKYRRSAALSEQPSPEEVRPSPVLVRTMNYLKNLCDDTSQPFHMVYAFVRDRSRSIRQDLTFQGIRNDTCVLILEECVRFHILAEFKLRNASIEEFSSRQNIEQLDKCLITLRDIYKERRAKNKVTSIHEAEMQSYYLLLHVFRSEARVQIYSGLSRDIFGSDEVKFAHKVSQTISSSFVNYVRFFQLFAAAPCLFACMMQRYFGKVRGHVLNVLSKVYSQRGSGGSFLISELTEWLGLDSATETLLLCKAFNLPVSCEEPGSVTSIVTVKGIERNAEPECNLGCSLLERSTSEITASRIIAGESHRFRNYSWKFARVQEGEKAKTVSNKTAINESEDEVETNVEKITDLDHPPLEKEKTEPAKKTDSFNGLSMESKVTFAPSLIASNLPSFRQPATFQLLNVEDKPRILPFQSSVPVKNAEKESNIFSEPLLTMKNSSPLKPFALFNHNHPEDKPATCNFQPPASGQFVDGTGSQPSCSIVPDPTSVEPDPLPSKTAQIPFVEKGVSPCGNPKVDDRDVEVSKIQDLLREKEQDMKALLNLTILEEEFNTVVNAPELNLDYVEKQLKEVAKEEEPRRLMAKLNELGPIVESVSEKLTALEGKAKSEQPIFADTEEKQEWILLDCKDDLDFAIELWKELWRLRRKAKTKLLRRGGTIGTIVDYEKLNETYLQNKKRGYGDDAWLTIPRKRVGAPLLEAQLERRQQSMTKLLNLMDSHDIRHFKISILSCKDVLQNGHILKFCKKLFSLRRGIESFPNFFYENHTPCLHKPIVLTQLCTENCQELKNSNILVIPIGCLSKDTVEKVRVVIMKAVESSHIDNYPALFLLVVVDNKTNGILITQILQLTDLARRDVINGFKIVVEFSGHKDPKELAKCSSDSIFNALDDAASKQVNAMVSYGLSTAACEAGDVALRVANVAWMEVMGQGESIQSPFETLNCINAAWRNLSTAIFREQSRWPSEHRLAQVRLRRIATVLKDCVLPVYSDHDSPGGYLAALANDVMPRNIAYVVLSRVRKSVDFVAFLARLMPPFVKKQMRDSFETTLELPMPLARKRAGKKILGRIMHIEVSSDADLFPDPDFSWKTDMEDRRGDENEAIRPSKRSRRYSSHGNELTSMVRKFTYGRPRGASDGENDVQNIERNFTNAGPRRASVGENDIANMERYFTNERPRRASDGIVGVRQSLPEWAGVDRHLRNRPQLIEELFAIERERSSVIQRAIDYVEKQIAAKPHA